MASLSAAFPFFLIDQDVAYLVHFLLFQRFFYNWKNAVAKTCLALFFDKIVVLS